MNAISVRLPVGVATGDIAGTLSHACLTYRDAGPSSSFHAHEFAPVDDDEPVGGGRLVDRFAEADMAISDAEALGGVSVRWVNQGLIGDEYRDAIS